jgi:hypothetical protein
VKAADYDIVFVNQKDCCDQYHYGLVLWSGTGIAQELVPDVEHFRLAAHQRFPASQHNYGPSLKRVRHSAELCAGHRGFQAGRPSGMYIGQQSDASRLMAGTGVLRDPEKGVAHLKFCAICDIRVV